MKDVTELQNEETVVETSTEVNEVETLKTQLAEAQKSIEALAKKKEQLYEETKKAKQIRDMAEKEKQEQLKRNGEYEKLYKTELEEKQKIYDEYNNFKTSLKQERVNNAATKLAIDLAKGDADRAELLSVFVAQSLSTMADDLGRVDDTVLGTVKKQFESDKRFSPLVSGNLATGGGATGSVGRASNTKQSVTRSEFERLDPAAKMELMTKVRSGKAELTDN